MDDFTPFSLENTLQCGQLFRWKKNDGSWTGIVAERVIKIRQKANVLEFEGANASFIKGYFRLDDDLPLIASCINRDHLMERALHRFPGLRIARQDPWECLTSYICATYKNIPAIKSMISELSRRFGQKILFEGKSHFSFPTPDSLANATVNDLSSCGLGFRARAVREAAKHVRTGKVDFDSLKKASCKTAKSELLCLPGVGNKVADCTLLFSLEKLSAFPVDIWMKRVIKDHYSQNFDALFAKSLTEGNSLSTKAYERISEFAQGYFGKFAGYAQQYLFHYYRSLRNKACKS